MVDTPGTPRFAEGPLLEALADTPVVLLHGPRQVGKTTLARRVGLQRDAAYLTFDDEVTLSAARSDPVGFLAGLPGRVVLDEVQRVPEMFTSIKAAVDRRRSPGRFLLTGSANVLLLPKLADSLAGRMEVLRLHPLAQCEMAGRRPDFLVRLFAGRFPVERIDRLGPDLADRIAGGGYPEALARTDPRRRRAWYRNYLDAIAQRDVRDLARIRSLDALPRLLALAAGQTARMINITELAGPFEISRPTIRDYLALLEQVFLLERVPPWHSRRLARLLKTPKLHITDTGLACALLGLDGPALHRDRETLGRMLETFVLQETRRQASWHGSDFAFHHYRDKEGVEVDIVLERDGRDIAGIEVKAGATVRSGDFRGLRKLAAAAGKRFAAGVVLYDGETSTPFGEGMFAVPLRRLWEPPPARG